MKKIVTLVLAISSALSACAAVAPVAHAQPSDPSSRHGALVVTGRAVRAVAAGPVQLHAYSAIAGGALFLTRVVNGNDGDCAAALAADGIPRTTPLVADQVSRVSVGAGQMACLVTSTDHTLEFLWHSVVAGHG